MSATTDCRLYRVLMALQTEPWALPTKYHKQLTEIARAHAFGGDDEERQHAVAETFRAAGKKPKRDYEIVDGTAIVPVDGVIGRKFSNSLNSSGVTSIDVLDRIMGSVADDDEVDSCMMVFDSPGGMVMGVPEAARTIRRVRQSKPVVAYADGLMDSAAYWLGSQADAIYGTESADIGSIGCYIALLDESRAMEMEGLRVEMFKSGKHKGMGYPGLTLSDEQREMLQADVNRIAADFKAAVRAGRGGSMAGQMMHGGKMDVADEMMQGQSFSAADALAGNLIDGIMPMESALREARLLAKMKKQ